MSRFYTTTEVVTTVTKLTTGRLNAFVSAEIVTPLQSGQGPVYTAVDLARLELCCELADGFELEPDALALVLALVDRLHRLDRDTAAMAAALAAEPAEIRSRIAARIISDESGETA